MEECLAEGHGGGKLFEVGGGARLETSGRENPGRKVNLARLGP